MTLERVNLLRVRQDPVNLQPSAEFGASIA